MSRHTSMATGGHCAVPQSALYEHGLLVGVVFGPERASSPCCQAASARGGHSDELGELLWAGDVADGDTEPPGNSRPPSGRPRTRPGHPPRGGRDRGRPDAGMLPQWRARVGPSQRIAGTHSATESSANTSASGSPPDPAPMRIPDRQHPASRIPHAARHYSAFVGLSAVRGRRVAGPGRWADCGRHTARRTCRGWVTGRRDWTTGGKELTGVSLHMNPRA